MAVSKSVADVRPQLPNDQQQDALIGSVYSTSFTGGYDLKREGIIHEKPKQEILWLIC